MSEQEMREALTEWRGHIPATFTLAEPIDPARDHIVGDPSASLTVLEYGDYECEECAQAHRLRELVDGWIQSGRLRFVFRHFPLIDAHPRALRAAQALEAAAEQGRFEEMHDVLMHYELVMDYSGQEQVLMDAALDDDGLLEIARKLGLDLGRFQATIDDPATLEHIMRDFHGGLHSGVNGTPTFYLGDDREGIERQDVVGPEELVARIDDQLSGN